MRLQLKHYIWQTVNIKCKVEKITKFHQKTLWCKKEVLLTYIYVNDSITIDHMRVPFTKHLKNIQKWDVINFTAVPRWYWKRWSSELTKIKDVWLKDVKKVRIIWSDDAIRNLVINIFWYA
mgnify:CR=1 FL=1